MKKEDIDFIISLLIRAGTILTELYSVQQPETNMKEIMVKFKKLNGTVSNIIQSGLKSHFPDIAWSADEFNISEQHQSGKEDYWVADTLDGGVNFMHGFKPWTITLTRVLKNHPVFAVVYDPLGEEVFYAVKHGGAYLNGNCIHVSNKADMNFAIMGTAFPNDMLKEIEQTAETLSLMQKLSKKIFTFRMLGPASIQFAYVACGRIDGYVEYGDDIYDWLAGALIVKEAGGTVTAANGIPFSFGTVGVIASNGLLHGELTAAVIE